MMRPFAFVGILLTLSAALSALFDHRIPQERKIKQYWNLQHRNQSYTVAVLGSSRAYVNIDTKKLEELLGSKIINLSLNGSSYLEQYLVLNLFLRENRVKTLLLQVDEFCISKGRLSFPFHYYYYFPFLDDGVVFDCVKEACGLKAYVWKYVPFIKYACYNSEVGPRQFISSFIPESRRKAAIFDSKGSYLIDRTFDKSQLDKLADPEVFKIDETEKKYVRLIVETARAKGVEVVLFTAPEYYIVPQFIANRDQIMQFYKDLAVECGGRFHIFDDLDVCENIDYFFDLVHLNKQGAERFTEKLAWFLNSPFGDPAGKQASSYKAPDTGPL